MMNPVEESGVPWPACRVGAAVASSAAKDAALAALANSRGLSADREMKDLAFSLFTSRLPKEKASELNDRIATISESDGYEFGKIVDKCDWDNPLFHHKDAPVMALKAFKFGLVSRFAVSRLMVYYSAKEYVDDVANSDRGQERATYWFPLFTKDERGTILLDPTAEKMIKEAFSQGVEYMWKKTNLWVYKLLYKMNGSKKAFCTMQGAQFDQWCELMKKSSADEQQLVLVPETDKVRHAKQQPSEEICTVSHHIEGPYGRNGWRVAYEGKFFRLIPSFAMIANFLSVMYSEDAVMPSPVLGISDPKDILQNGRDNARDCAIPAPGVTLPGKVDGALAKNPIDVLFHDYNHCIMASEIPKSQRGIIASLAERLFLLDWPYAKEPMINTASRLFGQVLCDMDNESFYAAFRGAFSQNSDWPVAALLCYWSLASGQLAVGSPYIRAMIKAYSTSTRAPSPFDKFYYMEKSFVAYPSSGEEKKAYFPTMHISYLSAHCFLEEFGIDRIASAIGMIESFAKENSVIFTEYANSRFVNLLATIAASLDLSIEKERVHGMRIVQFIASFSSLTESELNEKMQNYARGWVIFRMIDESISL